MLASIGKFRKVRRMKQKLASTQLNRWMDKEDVRPFVQFLCAGQCQPIETGVVKVQCIITFSGTSSSRDILSTGRHQIIHIRVKKKGLKPRQTEQGGGDP
ncbi:hypothetical protein CEXT_619981 [Caerostris extrusa]|uniref:Uncharacterized protein n=1 Tax=Caerostris extrusa TaxID=172846 RepID=A0AAV4Y6R2_CAEEX|nr:hypothetical protein CEXT_619981 [Caerostris extrusa]